MASGEEQYSSAHTSPLIGYAPSVYTMAAALMPPSSPRRDTIHSVDQRVAAGYRRGVRARQFLQNAGIRRGNAGLSYNRSADRDMKATFRLPQLPTSVRGGKSIATAASGDEIVDTVTSKKLHKHLRLRALYELLDKDMIVRGEVCNKTNDGVTLHILQVYMIRERRSSTTPSTNGESKARVKETTLGELGDLHAQGICLASELDRGNLPLDCDPRDLLQRYKIGQPVLALVLSADSFTGMIYLTMDRGLMPHFMKDIELGVTSSIIPTGLCGTASSSTQPSNSWEASTWFNHPANPGSVNPKKEQNKSFIERLKLHPLYQNPEGLKLLAEAFGVPDHGSLQEKADAPKSYLDLRKIQNLRWIKTQVAFGREHFRLNRYGQALQEYSNVINHFPVQAGDAYYERGCVYRALGKYEQALSDLERAHQLDTGNSEIEAMMYTVQSEMGLHVVNLHDEFDGNVSPFE